MKFSKKTLVVMMCAALQAGVVMAKDEEVKPVMPDAGQDTVALGDKDIAPVEGESNVAHHYYAYSLNSGLNYDGTQEQYKTEVTAQSTAPLTLKVLNNADTGPGERPFNSMIMAGGIVSTSIGDKGHEASTSIKVGSTLDINVTNNKAGTEGNVTSAFGVTTYTKGKAATTSTFDGDVAIGMTNHADYSDLVGISQHVLDGGLENSTFSKGLNVDLQQKGAHGVVNALLLGNSFGGVNKMTLIESSNINFSGGEGDASGLMVVSNNELVEGEGVSEYRKIFGEMRHRNPRQYVMSTIAMGEADEKVVKVWSSLLHEDVSSYVDALKKEKDTIFNSDLSDEEYQAASQKYWNACEAFGERIYQALPGAISAGMTVSKDSVSFFESKGMLTLKGESDGFLRGIEIQASELSKVNASYENVDINLKTSLKIEGEPLDGDLVSVIGLNVAADTYASVAQDFEHLKVVAKIGGGENTSGSDKPTGWGVIGAATGEASSTINVKSGLEVEAPNGVLLHTWNSNSPGKSSVMRIDGGVSVESVDKAFETSGPGSELVVEDTLNKVNTIVGDLFATSDSKMKVNLKTSGSTIVGSLLSDNGSELNVVMDGADVAGAGFWNDLSLSENNNNGKLSVSLDNGARWYFFDDGRARREIASALQISHGSEVIFPKAAPDGLYVKDLSGDGGVFVMPLDASKNEGNAPSVNVRQHFSGHHFMDLRLENDENPVAAVGTVLARVKDGDGEFEVLDKESGLFWKHVDLKKLSADEVDEDNADDGALVGKEFYKDFWVIQSISDIAPADKPTALVDSIVSSRLAGHALWSGRLADDTLMERLGDIRLSGEESNGLWIRSKHSRAKLDDVYSLKMNTHHYELGYDYSSASDNGRVFWGGSFNWDDGKADLRRGDSKMRSVGISLYRSQTFDNGWYVDTIARIDRQRNKLKSTDADGKAYDGSVNQWGFSLSGEVGRTFDIAKDMFVQPEAQLTFGRLNGKSFATSNDVSIDADAVKALISRIGVKAGMTFDSNKGNVYAKADLLREWMGKDVVSLATKAGSLEVTEKNRKTWGRVGLGANYHFNKALSAHGSFDYDIKSRWGDHASVNVGVRYSF